MTTKSWIVGAVLAGLSAGAISLVYAQAGYEAPKANEEKGISGRHIMPYVGTGTLQVSKDFDKNFVEKAISGNLFGTKLFDLIQQKSTHPEIKDFARRLQEDHKQSLERLKTIAKNKNWTVSEKPEKWQEGLLERLSTMDPADLDSCFLFEMVGLHYNEIMAYKFVAKKAEDPEVKAFAVQTIPTLYEHLEMTLKLTEQLTGVRPPHVGGVMERMEHWKEKHEKGGIEKGGGMEEKGGGTEVK